VKRLCQENAWLRDELASTQQKLQTSEQACLNSYNDFEITKKICCSPKSKIGVVFPSTR
jgi:hypothetical protein